MIEFFTRYWTANKDILLSQNFHPKSPSENYPVLYAEHADKKIIGVYSDHIIRIKGNEKSVDIINAKRSSDVVILIENTVDIKGITTIVVVKPLKNSIFY